MARRKSAPKATEPTYEDPPPEVPPAESPDPALDVDEALPPVEALDPRLVSADVPAPKWFRVVRGGRFAVEGSLHHLPEGSQVSEATHSLEALAAAGIVLEPSDAPVRPVDCYGEPR